MVVKSVYSESKCSTAVIFVPINRNCTSNRILELCNLAPGLSGMYIKTENGANFLVAWAINVTYCPLKRDSYHITPALELTTLPKITLIRHTVKAFALLFLGLLRPPDISLC